NDGTITGAVTLSVSGPLGGSGSASGNGGNGVFIHDGAQSNIVRGNVISGNTGDGVNIDHSGPTAGTSFNVVTGNIIGLDATATDALGNKLTGVVILNESNNTIGGTAGGAANVIAFNGGAGVEVVGATATGDSIRGNSIHDNYSPGILLVSGANNGQAAPVL